MTSVFAWFKRVFIKAVAVSDIYQMLKFKVLWRVQAVNEGKLRVQ